MQELNFKVDENKCIKCGLCAKDCIAYVIEKNENGVPEAKKPDNCIGCGHCMAVCPSGAISIFGKTAREAELVYKQSPNMILNLIKSRRSYRQYKRENLDKDTLNKLKSMLKWVPTGCNAHSLYFSFIDEIEVMNEFREYTNEKIINVLQTKCIKLIVDKFSPFLKYFIQGEDIIFRGAPHLVAVSNKVSAPCSKEDAIIALSYFELYAQSLGVATCWCGFGDIVLKAFPELYDYLKVPYGYKVQYVMLFGPKGVNYPRCVQNSDVQIVSAEKTGIQKISFLRKIKRLFWNNIR